MRRLRYTVIDKIVAVVLVSSLDFRISTLDSTTFKMDCLLKTVDDSNSAENFALHLLNDDCLLELYKYLPLKDSKNLAETSKRLKHLHMYRYHKFTFEFHSDMFNKTSKNGKQVLDNILSEYGQYLRSWSLNIHLKRDEGVNSAGAEVLKTVSKYSTNLRRLEFTGFYLGVENFLRDCGEAVACFQNVETLIFLTCFEVKSIEFLQSFRKLKHLYFDMSGTTTRDLQIIFQNNPEIEFYYNNRSDSFCGDSHNFGTFTSSEFNLCEFGPKFRKLCLGATCDGLDMEHMLRLATTNLTSLKLDFHFVGDLTIFLNELAKRGILKELELVVVKLDRDGCNIIQSFRNLELLVLCPGYSFDTENKLDYKIDSTFIWPPNLKRLRSTIEITDTGFTALLDQLKFLSHLQLDSFRNGYGCLETMYQSRIRNQRLRRPTLHILHDTRFQNYNQVVTFTNHDQTINLIHTNFF